MEKNKRDAFCAYLTNKTHYVGNYDLPEVCCHLNQYPDYICLYNERKNYFKTPVTAVGFFVDDYKFDSLNGIYYALSTKNIKLLAELKQRFEGCRYVIAPDYSTYRDMPLFLQIWNIARSRIVFIWLLLECGVTAIPMAGWGSEETLEFCFDGIEKGSAVAISLKGAMNNSETISLARKAIFRLIDKVSPEVIIVYAVCSDELLHDFFASIDTKETKIVIPPNALKERNAILKNQRCGN